MNLRKIENLEFMKLKRGDLGIWDFFLAYFKNFKD